MKIAILGRHESPAQHFVLDEPIPDDKITNYNWMRSVCQGWLYEHWEPHMELYVEGFTPMTIAFLREWEELRQRTIEKPLSDMDRLTLTLQHYQPKTGEYHPQVWRA